MPSHVAFLRAVNLGGRRRASSVDIRAALEEAGFDEVSTFRASGNVVLAGRGSERRLARAVKQSLTERFGFTVDVYLRSAAELRRLVAHANALSDRGERVQVAFLRSVPGEREREEILSHATEHERLAFAERELLWLRTGPSGPSELNLRAIEKLTGPWTMRTLDTVAQIVSRHFD